eukprot:SAG25_NODE_6442_length_559_cov_1.117391_1_plen_53_part_10
MPADPVAFCPWGPIVVDLKSKGSGGSADGCRAPSRSPLSRLQLRKKLAFWKHG